MFFESPAFKSYKIINYYLMSMHYVQDMEQDKNR